MPDGAGVRPSPRPEAVGGVYLTADTHDPHQAATAPAGSLRLGLLQFLHNGRRGEELPRLDI